jgi:acyl-CoA thioester hydrolase
VRLSIEPTTDPGDYEFVHRIRVRFAETDAMGIVHHSRYLPYLEETRVEFLRRIDRPYDVMRAEGLDFAVLEAFVRYRSPLRFDDVVHVHLRVGSISRTTFQIGYLLTVVDDARPAATAVTVHAAVTSTGRPTRLPAWMLELG